MRVARQQVSGVSEADGDASVARVGNVLEDKGPHRLLAVVYVCGQRGASLVLGALVTSEVIFGQLLDELRVVQDNGGSLLCLFLGDCLGAAAPAQVGARLLRLAQGLVDDVPLVDALGLHGSNASENVQHLLIAGKSDLSIEVELVHGGQVGAAVGRVGYQNCYAIPGGQVAEKGRGVDKASGVCGVSIGGEGCACREEKRLPRVLQEAMARRRKERLQLFARAEPRRRRRRPPIACSQAVCLLIRLWADLSPSPSGSGRVDNSARAALAY